MALKSGRGFAVASQDSGVVVITFDEPERMNGMTAALKRDLIETLAQAQQDDEIRVLVFTGTGAAFSAGDDVAAYRDAEAELTPPISAGHDSAIGTVAGLRLISQTLNLAVRNLDKLTVAAINGYAIQSGLSLALACDFRIAATDAKLGSATLRFGFLPDEGGHYLLVQHLGVGRALEFLMRKRIVGAAEALELGLVHQVVAPDRLLDAALDLARELADGPQVAMRLLKRAVYQAADLSFPQALEDIAVRTGISDHHPDAREGANAFREKRLPRFNA